MKTIAFRYANVYGERSRHVGTYAPAISKFLKCKKNLDPLTIFGDGMQRRDFIHVSDVVSANLKLTSLEFDGWGDVFNIGYGKNYSIQEIADFISNAEDQVYYPARPGEMRETLSDISKATEILGWSPKVDVMEWITSQL